ADTLDDGLDYAVDFESDNDDTNQVLSDEDDIAFDNENEGSEDGRIVVSKISKRKNKSENNKFAMKKKQKLDQIVEQKVQLAKMDNSLIADFIASKIKAKNENLSTIELDELYINQNRIKATTDWGKGRDEANFMTYLRYYFKSIIPKEPKTNKKESVKEEKKPVRLPENHDKNKKFVVVLCQSAIRVCDLHRATKKIPGGSLKLINKNKLEADEKLIKTTPSVLAISTPGRIIKLIDNNVITLEQISDIVLDSSFLDSKKHNVWDLSETIPTLKRLLSAEGSRAQVY
ncbi:hypothetical protein NADFUDRAFT_7930, partial [Nadsonia fulvescens var. elongata DSM 6958]